MEHVVFFPSADGSPAFRRVANLEEAVRLVEHLRNVEGVASVSVHALSEVPLAFRAYYKVEVPEAVVPVQLAPVDAVRAVEPEVEAAPVALAPEPEVPALALVEDAPVEEPVLASSNGHAAAGPASLGFFA